MTLTTFEDFFQSFRQALTLDLPGLEAHRQMAPPGRLEDKKRYEPQADARTSGVLILIYPREDRLYFPLIVRPTGPGVHSGQVALPGGKIEEADQDVVDTALRETEEEIGVSVPRTQLLGSLSEIYIPPSNYMVYPAVAYVEELPDFIPQPSEVASILHIDLFDFIQDSRKTKGKVAVRGHYVEVPYFDLESKMVWGATAMILSEFLSILRGLEIKIN